MIYNSKEEAQKSDKYFSVCDPFGSAFYPIRFSTLAEAWKEKKESNIGGDLDIIEVDTVNQTIKGIA